MATKVLNGLDLQNNRIVNLASPASATDAANKSYVDARVAGLSWKQQVRAATTTALDLDEDFEDGDVVDGVTLAEGDRILIKDQADPEENGIYIVAASGTPTRAEDADSAEELYGATVFVAEGDVNEDTAWTQIADNITIDASAVTWVQFGAGSGGSYSADGQGIEETGGVFSLELDGATLSKSASGLKINDAFAGDGLEIDNDVMNVTVGDGLEIDGDGDVAIDLASNSGLAFSSGDLTIASTIAGSGLNFASGVLSVGAGTGISVGASAVSVDTSVVARKASGAIGNGASTTLTFNHNLGTEDVVVEVYDATTKETVLCDVTRTSSNQVSLSFATAPSSNAYRVVVTG